MNIPQIDKNTIASYDDYQKLYEISVKNPDDFWRVQAQRIDWVKPFTIVKNTSFENDVQIKWFEDGLLNVCYNCVDRHLPEHGDKIAFHWQGDEEAEKKSITYKELHENVCKLANYMKSLGLQKGDRVAIYLPMILEAVYSMLACARLGLVHTVIFGGFSSSSLAGRIQDCQAKLLITSDIGKRGGKIVPLKDNADEALDSCSSIESCLVVMRGDGDVMMRKGRDVWWDDVVLNASKECDIVPVGAEDPLFILYTSGSTGKPKGVLHTSAGYLVYASLTHQVAFDIQDDDVFWCTADVGWVTGHSYVVYGPLSNAVTSVIYEGVPNYPDFSRLWKIVDEYFVTHFYTAPTLIRSLMREGDDFLKNTYRQSLRILGSVGEPINPEPWKWFYETIGKSRCPIIDTWWQTETGGFLITPIPQRSFLKPGSATKPFLGIEVELLDNDKNIVLGEGEGNLCIKSSWPGQMRTLYGDHQRFMETYFKPFSGYYFSGDGARRDAEGDFWITGRVDDVLNVSGHRLGSAELENALLSHKSVAEAAVIGFPHEIKGEGIYAFVIFKQGIVVTDALLVEVKKHVRDAIGPIATIDALQWVDGLPKTRSGKIMRRILRKIATKDFESLGDTSTLADPQVVENLIKGRAMVA